MGHPMQLHGHKSWVLSSGIGSFPYSSVTDAPPSLIDSKILSIMTKQTFRHQNGLPSGIVLCFIRLHLKECSQLCSTGTLHEWIGALHFPTVKMIFSDVIVQDFTIVSHFYLTAS